MKHNTKKVLDIIASQGNERNATKAYKEVHPNASDNTARNNVSQLLKKPEAQLYLQEHITNATETSVDILNNAKNHRDSVQWQELAGKQVERILDRAIGKPIQVTENRSTSLQISIDLKGMDIKELPERS